jgi:hypothetical protein
MRARSAKRTAPDRWYHRFRSGGPEALEDKPSKPDRVWNRIPDDIRQRVVVVAFEQPELSPRELATRFTDTNSYYVSESSVYRLLKAHYCAQPALADRFHLSQGDRLGVVLPLHHPR